MKKYYAGIDIGTNTLLLLILSKDDSGVMSIEKDVHRIARLGEGIHESGTISKIAIDRTSNILKEYAQILKEYDAIQVHIVATSAMRDAQNRSEVLQELEIIIGYPIHCISGNQEAIYTYLGSKEQYKNPIILDIGGGSTEYITGNEGDFNILSLDIGAFRLHDMYMNSLPLSKINLEHAKTYIRQYIQQLPIQVQNSIIATAGTPTTLAAIQLGIDDLSNPQIHGYVLSLEAIEEMTHTLVHSSLEDILAIPGVHPQRADILPAGALILYEILRHVKADSCIVSKKGLRFGVAYSIMD